MNYLIDTDICIYIMNHNRPRSSPNSNNLSWATSASRLLPFQNFNMAYPQAPIAKEIRRGCRNFWPRLKSAAYDHAAALAYGEIRHDLESSGRTVGPLDMLIAARALGHAWTLVTNNDNEFNLDFVITAASRGRLWPWSDTLLSAACC